jgi:hypothetical protein
MTWRSSLWVRWLGWTALYALILYGGAGVVNALGFDRRLSLSGTSGTIVSLLILAVLAFAIGVRFRSRWWGLGPLEALALPLLAGFVAAVVRGLDAVGIVWFLAFAVVLVVYGALLSLATLAGVWWGERRHEPDAGLHNVGLPRREIRPWGSWPT